MTQITELPNLGATSARLLATIGVYDAASLRAIGAVEAYCLLKAKGQPVSLNLLWAMHGALTGQRWQDISAETKQQLRDAVAAFRFR